MTTTSQLPQAVPVSAANRCWCPRFRLRPPYLRWPKVRQPGLFSGWHRRCRTSAPADSARMGSAPPRKSATQPKSTRESKIVAYSSLHLRDNHSIASLQADVLLRILALDHFFIVKRKPLLRSIRSLSKNVDRLLFREVFETPGHRNRIEHGGRARQQKGARSAHHTQDVHLLTLAVGNNDRNFRLRDIALQTLGDLLFQLLWCLAA